MYFMNLKEWKLNVQQKNNKTQQAQITETNTQVFDEGVHTPPGLHLLGPTS